MLRSAVRALLPRWLTDPIPYSPLTRRPRRASLGIEALEDRAVPAVITVTSLADIANPLAGVVTLRSAVNLANTNGNSSNTIDLAVPGTYQLTQGQLAITATTNLTIQNTSSGAVIIDGGGVGRVFDINAAGENTTPFTVTFQGLTIQDGVASPGDGADGSGGGIRAQEAASVVLNNVILQHDTATADGGGIAMESPNNDAIGTLTITNSVIANNHAGDAGGGVESDGTGAIVIVDSSITDNTCINQGAGVWLDAGTANLTMTGDVVNGNQALFMLGGGIGNAGSGNVALIGCTVENNSCGATVEMVNGTPTLVPGTGGGFADAANAGDLTVTDCVFLDNTAAGDGGGIQEGGPNTTITGTVFQGNIAGDMGGAAFLNGTTATLTNDILRHNVAVDGGAVEADANTFAATSCTFRANVAQGNNSAIRGFGGAIDIRVNAISPNDTLANCLFVANTANNGVTSNGGAVAFLGGALDVTRCQFTSNITAGHGGAIDAAGKVVLTVTGSTFNNNQASFGGAVALDVGQASTVSTSTFVGNTAIADGGALIVTGGGVSAYSDTINGNTSGNIGGGIALLNGGALQIGDTIVFHNQGADSRYVDLFGVFILDRGSNAIGVPVPITNGGIGDLFGVNPLLGVLVNNGGPRAGAFSDAVTVQTEALLPGSPAIGAGVNGLGGVAFDERQFPSPAAGRANVSIGAFEPQYAKTAPANQAFIENTANLLLNQPTSKVPSVSATNLAAALTHGSTPAAVVAQLENTTTYRTIAVTNLFGRDLNRTPSATELQKYINLILNGESLEQLAASLLATPEFYNAHGGTNAGFVEGLFELALGRAPSPTELANITQQLANHVSRTTVAMNVLSSAEYRTALVIADFASTLGRAPTGTEQSFYVAQLQNGTRDQTVLAELLALKESFTDRA